MEEEEKSYRLSVISYQWKRREVELSVVGGRGRNALDD
jgi:hypothetical protein